MGSLTGGTSFHTFNEEVSGGASGAGAATIACRYTFSVSAGIYVAGSVLFGKLYNLTVTAAGVAVDGTVINVKTSTQTPTGGVYGNGTVTHTCTFNSTIVTIAGIYVAGTAPNTEIYSFIATTGGAKVYGAYAERDIPDMTRYAPRPAILFEVVLYDYNNVVSFLQPDSISNIVRLKQITKLNVPGVIEGLKHGDQFTLYGAHAIEVQDIYSDFLTVISTT